MKRKRMDGPERNTSAGVVLDEELIRRIDALIPELSTEWRKATRSDVLRKLIFSGLEILEKQQRAHERHAKKPARPRRTRKLKR